jgi:tRNA (cmo5U34)-methyltransferase
MARNDTIWQSSEVALDFLEGMRGAIPLAGEQIDVMLRLIGAALPTVDRFLDLGCGDGVLGRALFSRYPNAGGVLLDFSEPMLEVARQKVQASNAIFIAQDYGLAEWVKGIEAYTPFDAIVSGYSIHHQPDSRKRELYADIYGLLKPGGVFINIEHVSSPSRWLEALGDEVFIDSLMAYNARQGISKPREAVAQEFHDRPHKEANILAPVETQLQWLREIGFQQVDCYLKIFELAVFGGLRG